MTPRASPFQYGANNPEKAGTKYTPPLSSTVLARSSISGALLISPMLSRIHWTSYSVMAMEPSSMYAAGWSPIL